MAALIDGAAAQAPPAVRPCPECGHPLGAGIVLCTHCGFNTRSGKTLSTRRTEEAEPGGPSGGPRSERDRARDFEAREAQRIARLEFIKPILIGAAALGGIAAMLATQHKGGDRFLPLDKYVPFYLGSVGAATIVFVLASLVRIGRDSITGINLVRLAAIVAVVDLLRVPMVLYLGGTFELWAGLLLAYMVLLYHLLDLDVSDAVVVGVMLGGGQIAAGFLIIAPLLR